MVSLIIIMKAAIVAVVMASVMALIDERADIGDLNEFEFGSDPDVNADFTGMCLNHGYHVESYTVSTDDGY